MKFVYLLFAVLFLASMFLLGCGDIFGGDLDYKYSKYYLYKMNPDGSEQEKISKLSGSFQNISVASDEKLLASFDSDKIEIIDLETGEVIKEIETSINYNSLKFSSNSQFLLYATISSVNYYNLYTDEVVELWNNYMGDYPIFVDSTRIIYTTYLNSQHISQFKRLDLATGDEDIVYSCASVSTVNSFNIRDNNLYFMFDGEDEYNANTVLRKVDIVTGSYFDFNSTIGGDYFDISPNGNFLLGSSSNNQNRLRVFTSDGMDFIDTYDGRYAVFADDSNVLYIDDNNIYYGKLDGSMCSKSVEGEPMFYQKSKGKVYYVKEKKIYE